MDDVRSLPDSVRLVPLFLLNRGLDFVSESLIVTVALADVVFCLFNFRPKGKAKCFAGDGGDGCLTICHRIMLHENLGEAHRKHEFQIMANELGIGHVKVASFYALL